MPSSAPAYTKTAIALHWLIALALIFMLGLGWGFADIPSGETKTALIQVHKSVGITILLLGLARIGWRLSHRVPPLPDAMPAWEKRAARIVHTLLYIATIEMPLSGWAMVSANPHGPLTLFGILPWPYLHFLPADVNKAEIARLLFDAHGFSASFLALLIAGHAAAALKHHFIARDDILLRMAPQRCAGFLNRLRGE
ncbi:MAG: cytochrome b [Alphaproteobacteria bacterium]|nr:cytochrome b [Alphaproteobacteria bacterium]